MVLKWLLGINSDDDDEDDRSRHGATSEERCKEMSEKYGWNLVDVEKTGNSILSVNCVFKGETKFPDSYNENDD